MRLRLLISLILGACLVAGADPYRPVGEYFGYVHAGSSVPSSPDPTFPKLLTLRSSQEWEDFVRQIPLRVISQRQPAPLSRDPLLKSCPVDFSNQAAVVGISDNIYLQPDLQRRSDGHFEVTARKLDGFDLGARPYGVGLYRLWVIPRQDLQP